MNKETIVIKKDMTEEEKDLLLQDLCARIPYGVQCEIGGLRYGPYTFTGNDVEDLIAGRMFKPYLRPMSSMTEEEILEFYKIVYDTWYSDSLYYKNEEWITFKDSIQNNTICFKNSIWLSDINKVTDYLNKKMFDFRGLIPKGLAEIAPEGMYELNYSASQNESDSVIDNTTKITVGCKIRSKTKPIEILSIISDDCHGDEFECSNGSVLSLKQIEKYYELIREE